MKPKNGLLLLMVSSLLESAIALVPFAGAPCQQQQLVVPQQHHAAEKTPSKRCRQHEQTRKETTQMKPKILWKWLELQIGRLAVVQDAVWYFLRRCFAFQQRLLPCCCPRHPLPLRWCSNDPLSLSTLQCRGAELDRLSRWSCLAMAFVRSYVHLHLHSSSCSSCRLRFRFRGVHFHFHSQSCCCLDECPRAKRVAVEEHKSHRSYSLLLHLEIQSSQCHSQHYGPPHHPDLAHRFAVGHL